MNIDTIKKYAISIGLTFGSTFLSVLGASLATIHSPEWTAAFWGGVVVAATRTAVKAVIDAYIPVRLGGRK